MFHFESVKDLQRKDEQWFIEYLEEIIWNGKPISPFDPTSKVYLCANGKYKCKNTGKYFTIKTGSIFERSKVKLSDFFYAGYMMFVNRKGIASLQLAEDLGVQQRTAWFIEHRLRKVAEDPLFKIIFKDFVIAEADETFVGGKSRNRHKDKKIPHSQGRSCKDKSAVAGTIDKKTGTLIAEVVPDTTQATLEALIRDNVKEGSSVYTDRHHGYNGLRKWYEHTAEKYVEGKASTNRIESAWAPFKRSYNIHHWISEKHLQRYIFQWVFRHNIRKYNKVERLKLFMSLVMGKRLTYKSLIRG